LITKILSFIIGAFSLIVCSGFQKVIIGANLFMIRGYIVPVIFGGIAGLIIGYYKIKWEKESARVEREKLRVIIEMAGAVCHEMNQPLQAISGLSEFLLMKVPEDNPLYPNLQKIIEQTDRMGEITGKLMNVTRYETKSYLKGKIVDIDKAAD